MEPTLHAPGKVQLQDQNSRRLAAKKNNVLAGQSACVSGLVHLDKLLPRRHRPSLTLELHGASTDKARITCGFAPGPFGDCLVATSDRGICWLDPAPTRSAISQLQNFWNVPRVRLDDDLAVQLVAKVFGGDGQTPALHLRGTEFQLRVWQALLAIEPGSWMSYGGLARELGMPRAARAVGRAVGANVVAVLVPCHRVLPASGLPGNYRWGADLKAALLRDEAAQPRT
jgi:O-6-methylguanine DNA methyltransferase